MKQIFGILLLGFVAYAPAWAQIGKWQTGLVKQEVIDNHPSYPSCHASTIAETPTGLVAAWFGGTDEGNPDVCIWVSHFKNGQWTPSVKAADGVVNASLRYPTWNPVLYQIPGGDLMLFYKVGRSPSTWEGWLKTSSDGGYTWSAAKALPEGYIGPVKNKPELLANGMLLCPSSSEGSEGWRMHMEMTPDFGKTWQRTGPLNDGKTINAIQPSILFHGQQLQLLARSKNRAVVEAWSTDNGKTWSAVTPSSLPNNNSGTDAVTLKNGWQLIVYNHVLPFGNLNKGRRSPLNVAVSKDGKNWQAAVILEDSPIKEYSYPSVIQTQDGLVHIVYTWRRERIKHAVLDPNKWKLYPIKDGKWPALAGYTAPFVEPIKN